MKMPASRRWSMALTLVLTLALVLTGCGGTSDNASAPADEGSGNANTESGFNKEGLPIVSEPITLKVLTMRWGNMGDTFTKNQWLQDLEKNTNVKIEWQVVSSNDWNEQKSIMLASGTLPDIILGDQTLSDSDIINNLNYFRPLDDYIDTYMPNLKAAMEQSPELKKISTFPDGKMYSLPASQPASPKSTRQPVINKQWLDKLGLAVPDTIEDLHTVFQAFKEQDPNGNGKKDEIPYTEAGLGALLDPFGITDLNNNNMMVKDGQPLFIPTSEEYKAGIKWANQLYSEGLIDKELYTQDGSMTSAKQQNMEAPIVGFSYQWTPDAVFGKWGDHYVAIPPLKGPDGQRYQNGNPNGNGLSRNQLLITTFCEYPEVAARWADQFYTDEASIQNFWGAIGTVIQKNEDGTYTLMDPPEGTSADAWYWEQSLRSFGPKYVSPSFEEKLVLNPETGDGLKLEIDKLGSEFVTMPFPSVMYTADEFRELPTLTTDIDSYVATMRAGWVTKGGIDKDWDTYIKKLNDMGLERLMQIRTEAYNRYAGAK